MFKPLRRGHIKTTEVVTRRYHKTDEGGKVKVTGRGVGDYQAQRKVQTYRGNLLSSADRKVSGLPKRNGHNVLAGEVSWAKEAPKSGRKEFSAEKKEIRLSQGKRWVKTNKKERSQLQRREKRAAKKKQRIAQGRFSE